MNFYIYTQGPWKTTTGTADVQGVQNTNKKGKENLNTMLKNYMIKIKLEEK
jgi:hypothetical protein